MSPKPLSIVKVIVRSPLWRDFDYLLPMEFADIQIGQRIVVPFGKRQVPGIVTKLLSHTDIPLEKLKPITDVLDSEPLVDESWLKLCAWSADYYHFPLGEVVFGVLPKKLRQCRMLPVGEEVESWSSDVQKAEPLELSRQQQQALTKIQQREGYQVALLHGVTGSGKTEIYLQLISAVLAQGRQALVLVPEISLTPQTFKRFEARFNVPVVALHSGLTEKQRFEAWVDAQSGNAGVLIGTRSAVFTPMSRLGIIVIDEEHDVSLKQQSGFRYHARDVAIVRAHQLNIPIILGSATPSLESLYNAWQTKRYYYESLTERATGINPPEVSLVDIRKDNLKSGLGTYLLENMHKNLVSGGQVLLFLNRRGFAPVLLCHHCGYSAKCPRCDVYLTYHHKQNACRCHHCDFIQAAQRICQECHQSELLPVGLGTEQLELELAQLFPQQKVLRIDRDTTRKKGALENMLEEAHTQQANILVGTQMLAKGHHFSKLSLVAIVDADSGLLSTDFRALERLAQLLIQVSGRAGRESKSGEVIVQTHYPEHPLLQSLLQGSYSSFARKLLEVRDAAMLPPYYYLALFRAESANAVLPREFLHNVSLLVKKANLPVDVLGPMEAAMQKRGGKYRFQLLLRAAQRGALQKLLFLIMQDQLLSKKQRALSWSLDVDPVELI